MSISVYQYVSMSVLELTSVIVNRCPCNKNKTRDFKTKQIIIVNPNTPLL